MPIRAYIFMTVQAGYAEKVIRRLSGFQGVKTTHTVTGPYDIVAFVEVPDITELRKLILEQMHPLEGVDKTITSLVI